VVLWIGHFPFRDAPQAVLRYDGMDEDGRHVWLALFDEKLEQESYLVHQGSSSPRNRIEVKFVPAAELAAAAKNRPPGPRAPRTIRPRGCS
jgi:hypothetical protein